MKSDVDRRPQIFKGIERECFYFYRREKYFSPHFLDEESVQLLFYFSHCFFLIWFTPFSFLSTRTKNTALVSEKTSLFQRIPNRSARERLLNE